MGANGREEISLEIGDRIRRARQEAGLSQRQLCGDIITRNMLSLIENGGAVPSLQTLTALARRLQKPVGYFFGESPESLEPCWQALEAGDPEKAHQLLESTVGGSQRERKALQDRILLARAERAIEEDRKPLARSLLKKITDPLLDREAGLLLARAGEDPCQAAARLPSLDGELRLKAQAVLEKDPRRAGQLLDAAEDTDDPDWAMLRGRAYL